MPAASTTRKNLQQWRFFQFGGPEEIRTPCLLSAKQALYQLSYGPLNKSKVESYKVQKLMPLGPAFNLELATFY